MVARLLLGEAETIDRHPLRFYKLIRNRGNDIKQNLWIWYRQVIFSETMKHSDYVKFI